MLGIFILCKLHLSWCTMFSTKFQISFPRRNIWVCPMCVEGVFVSVYHTVYVCCVGFFFVLFFICYRCITFLVAFFLFYLIVHIFYHFFLLTFFYNLCLSGGVGWEWRYSYTVFFFLPGIYVPLHTSCGLLCIPVFPIFFFSIFFLYFAPLIGYYPLLHSTLGPINVMRFDIKTLPSLDATVVIEGYFFINENVLPILSKSLRPSMGGKKQSK